MFRILIVALILVSQAPVLAADQHNPRVLVKTDLGEFLVELFPQQAPATVASILEHANRFYYDGLIFHRVVRGFVIQTGAYTFDLFEKEPGEPIVNESANGLKNSRGTLAMARHSDPDSARSQFYINLRDNRNLDPDGDRPGYTVFGAVVEGMEVVDAIGKVRVRQFDEFKHLPVEPVRILSIREVDRQ
jgi:peptidyl-prolyl cis-trans isomerase A (cyclophilin A)